MVNKLVLEAAKLKVTRYDNSCFRVGRHSKSLDTSKKVCGICRGKFELYTQGKNGLTSTPAAARPPNKFAQFVKVSTFCDYINAKN